MKLENGIQKYLINDAHVYFENLGENQGKLIIDTGLNTYSTYWGSMSGNLYDFLLRIDNDYFANRLCSKNYSPNWKKTFTNIRKSIKSDLDLPWYEHQEFQKSMREKINEFEKTCIDINSVDWFISNIDYYMIKSMNFYLIENDFDARNIEKTFKGYFNCEPWHLVVETESHEYKYLKKLHNEIKKFINKCLK